jgi:hypothetical protein
MANDHLIDRLVGDLKPVRRRKPAREFLALAVLGAIEVVLFLSLGMMRPDMPMAMEAPSFWWKLGSLGLLAVVGAGVAVLSFDPVASPRRGLRWLGMLLVVSLAGGWVIDAARDGWPALAMRLNWQDGLQCVMKMVLLSVPAVIALGFLMRRGAPTDRAGSSLASGIAAAAWGAFVFVFACPYDDPFYIVVWYAVGCGLVTLFARLALPRFTRW